MPLHTYPNTSTSSLEEHQEQRMLSPPFRATSCSNTGTIAIDFGGNVWEWGKLFNTIRTKPSIVLKTKAVFISCGRKHACLIDKSGRVYTWGRGTNGRLGHGHEDSQTHPTFVSSLRQRGLTYDNNNNNNNDKTRYDTLATLQKGETIARAACGGSHTMVVTSTGRVFSFGFNRTGQCGIEPTKKNNTNSIVAPRWVSSFQEDNQDIQVSSNSIDANSWGPATDVVCGRFHTCVVVGCGKVVSFGSATKGRLGRNGRNYTMARGGGKVLSTTSNNQRVEYTWIPGEVLYYGRSLALNATNAISCGDAHTITIEQILLPSKTTTKIEKTVRVLSWGKGDSGQLGHGMEWMHYISAPKAIDSLRRVNVKSVSCGGNTSFVVSQSGRLFSFGDTECGATIQHHDDEHGGAAPTPVHVRLGHGSKEGTGLGGLVWPYDVVDDVSTSGGHTMVILRTKLHQSSSSRPHSRSRPSSSSSGVGRTFPSSRSSIGRTPPPLPAGPPPRPKSRSVYSPSTSSASTGGTGTGGSLRFDNPLLLRCQSLVRHNRYEELLVFMKDNQEVLGSVSGLRDEFGNTLLHCACQNGLKRMCKCLLRLDAEMLNRRNEKGKTALYFCQKYNHQNVFLYLQSKGGHV